MIFNKKSLSHEGLGDLIGDEDHEDQATDEHDVAGKS